MAAYGYSATLADGDFDTQHEDHTHAIAAIIAANAKPFRLVTIPGVELPASCPLCDGAHPLTNCPTWHAETGTPLIATLRAELAAAHETNIGLLRGMGRASQELDSARALLAAAQNVLDHISPDDSNYIVPSALIDALDRAVFDAAPAIAINSVKGAPR